MLAVSRPYRVCGGEGRAAVSVRLCHAGQNVLIVHNCLFNENIPLAAEPSPPHPLPLYLPGSLCRHRGGSGQQCRFLKTVQLSKWP